MITTALLLAAAQYPLERIAFMPSTQPEQRLGESFVELGDVNGDGVRDFAVGSPGHLPAVGWGSGLVEVYSGADGTQLYQINPIASVDSQIGLKLTVIGDVDYDGASDFVVGCGGQIAAYIISGRDGSRLASIDTQSNGQFGMQLQTIGDMTGDGLPEFAIGLPNDWSNGIFLSGQISIFNGADGSLHYKMHGQSEYRYLGDMIATPGDINQDGSADFVVGGLDGLAMSVDSGFTAINGANFQPMFSRDRTQLRQSAADLDAVGDLNRDGTNDLMVTGFQFHPSGNWFQGVTSIVSGTDGTTLFTILGDDFEDFGRSATALGDMDGDGTDDIGVLSFQLNRQWQIKPTVKVFSGNDGSLLSQAATPGFNFLVIHLYPLSDHNGDGRDELILGIPENQVGSDPPNFLPGGELHAMALEM